MDQTATLNFMSEKKQNLWMSKYLQENRIPNIHKLLKMIVELLLHIARKDLTVSLY